MHRPTDGLVVDFGCHHYPTVPEETEFIHSFIEGADGEAICSDLDVLLDRYAAAGVDAAVLSQPFYMGHPDAERVAAANDQLLEVVEANDDLYGLASVPTTAGEQAAAAELERCLEAGYHGGAVETRSGDVELSDPSLTAVFDVAGAADAPILVHPKLNDSLHPEVLDDEWKLNAIFGREVALAESVCKVVHEGVLDRHPDLTLVYHHNGGNIASMLPRIRLQLDRGRWPGLEGLDSYDVFKAQLEERIFLDTSGYFGDPAPFRRTLEEFPSSNLLYATDFPYETRRPEVFRRIVDSVRDVASGTDARKILGGNALDLLANAD